jgi:non-heme chloroperoxidase
MDAVGLDAAVIAGHSGGSYSAQRFALNHPQRTLGVLLVGAFRAFHDNPDVLELGKAISELSDPVDHEFVRRFQESTVAPPIPARFIETFCASQARTNAGAAR